jgi:hypothetical protein
MRPALPPLRSAPPLLAALVFVGCDGKNEDTSLNLPFCLQFEDADQYELEPLEDDDPASGEIWARVITDEGSDLDDPQYVAGVTYTLENVDVQGAPQVGETDQAGEFRKRVGAGTWVLRLDAIQGTYACSNELELAVEAGQRTVVCIDVGCEQ